MTELKEKITGPVLLAASMAILFLSGCEVPVLNSISPDTVNQAAQDVQVNLSGDRFNARSKLLIDGELDGNGTSITVADLRFIDAQNLQASLNIAADASPGAHTIAVGNPFGTQSNSLINGRVTPTRVNPATP